MELERKAVVVIITLLIMTLLISGCINIEFPSREREKSVVLTYLEMDLPNYSEVEYFNFSNSEQNLSTLNFDIVNQSDSYPGYHYRAYMVKNTLNNKTNMSVWIGIINWKPILSVVYSNQYPESGFPEIQNYIQSQVEIIAEACNVTLDWTRAEWTVNYA